LHEGRARSGWLHGRLGRGRHSGGRARASVSRDGNVTRRNAVELLRDLVRRVHDVGSLVMLQVTTVRQARHAAERGVDVIVAQGGEAGGFGGALSTLALVPQVVDAVHPIPVLAAGGIADGRGLAAALCLGAQGVNIGTRFLASNESSIDRRWQQAILAAESEDATKVDAFNEFFAALSGEYGAVPRTLSSPFVRQLAGRRQDVARDAERLRAEVIGAVEERRLYDLLPFAGETVGLIKEILPAANIVARIVAQAEQILEMRRCITPC
jgi:enoyl-[acyl-carrier protein] reductase II